MYEEVWNYYEAGIVRAQLWKREEGIYHLYWIHWVNQPELTHRFSYWTPHEPIPKADHGIRWTALNAERIMNNVGRGRDSWCRAPEKYDV